MINGSSIILLFNNCLFSILCMLEVMQLPNVTKQSLEIFQPYYWNYFSWICKTNTVKGFLNTSCHCIFRWILCYFQFSTVFNSSSYEIVLGRLTSLIWSNTRNIFSIFFLKLLHFFKVFCPVLCLWHYLGDVFNR